MKSTGVIPPNFFLNTPNISDVPVEEMINTHPCNHVDELHIATASASHCRLPSSLSRKPIRIMVSRRLPLAGQLRREDILQQNDDNVNVLGLHVPSK